MGWLGDLIQKVRRTESIDFFVSQNLSAGNKKLETDGSCYVSIKVASLRLPYTREMTNKIYGIVHAFAKLQSKDGADVQFAAATMPSQLAGVDPKNLQNIITMNKLVIGPTPWVAQNIDFQIGLFSVVSENLAAPFLETVTKLSETVGGAFAATIGPYVETLKFGIEKLTGAVGSVRLRIGLDTTLAPVAGTYAIVATPAGDLTGKTLSLDPNDKKLLVDGVHYTAAPYLVYEIESTSERANWGEIPELKASYQEITKSIKSNQQTEAEEALAVFRRLALISPDLTDADAATLIAKVEAVMKRAFGKADRARGEGSEVPDFLGLNLYDKTTEG